METERALQQLELLQKKLYAYHCADRAQRHRRGPGCGHEHSGR